MAMAQAQPGSAGPHVSDCGGAAVPAFGRDAWLAARRQGVTASEIAVIMGLAPESYGSPYALYHRKRGSLPEPGDRLTWRIGRHFERLAGELFTEARPEFTAAGDGRTLYAHPGRPWQLATPDRLLSDGRGLPAEYQCCEHHKWGYPARRGVAPCCDPDDCGPCCEQCPTCPALNDSSVVAALECKKWNTYQGWGPDGSDEIPVHFRCQVLWQCDVLGVDHWFLAVLFTHADKFRVYEGAVDGAARRDLDLMRAEGLAFRQRVLDGDPPPPDWRAATTEALKTLHPDPDDGAEAVIPRAMAARYLAACRAYKTAKRRKAATENLVRERLGQARRAVTRDGTPVARRDVYPVSEHVRTASITDRLMPAGPKEDEES